LGKWAECHVLIVSRVDVAAQYPRDSRRPRCVRNSCDLSRPAFSGLTLPNEPRRE
jgi:hypothetical protein